MMPWQHHNFVIQSAPAVAFFYYDGILAQILQTPHRGGFHYHSAITHLEWFVRSDLLQVLCQAVGLRDLALQQLRQLCRAACIRELT